MPQITVVLTVKLDVADDETASYFVDPATNTPTIGFIADLFDEFEDSFAGTVVTINDKTQAQVGIELQAQLNDQG
ncbi:MAG: hypothetical protein P4L77_12160 [Sulfuriferula sp.]|nr:hypothetical protein [Sulfuriferula sp.]